MLFLVMLFVCLVGSSAAVLAADEGLPEDVSAILGKTLEGALQGYGLTVPGWPEGKIPSDIPPYTQGRVVNSGGSEDEYMILVETNRDELQEYLKELEDVGWYVDYDRSYPSSRLRNITLQFQFNSSTMLQMTVYVRKLGPWPADQLPADIVPPEKGTLIGEVQIFGLDDDGIQYVVRYDYDGLTDADVSDYVAKLIERGWSGDEYQLYKDVEWNGDLYEAWIEPWYDEGAWSFNCNLFRK